MMHRDLSPEEVKLFDLLVRLIEDFEDRHYPMGKSSPSEALVTDYSKIITIEPDKRGGKPCIRGMRMTVTDVLKYLAGGMAPEEIVDEFPDLTLEDIRACLAFAADRERKLATLPKAIF